MIVSVALRQPDVEHKLKELRQSDDLYWWVYCICGWGAGHAPRSECMSAFDNHITYNCWGEA